MAEDRKIIHIDMDCFFAAVEMRDNPDLKGLPLAIGGRPGQRSVICTANYEARKFGIHSALSSDIAAKKCKNLIFIPPNMNKYKEVSNQIREIFFHFSELVEPLSLDEAYIDVTHCNRHGGSATLIAKEIKEKIFEKTKLTASAGVAPNKFLAKIASDIYKPDGLCVISPNDIPLFIKTLDVSKISGVGKVTNEKMRKLGIEKCVDLQKYDKLFLEENFGKFGKALYNYARGIDLRNVITSQDPKSLSVEHTFLKDLKDQSECQFKLTDLYQEFLSRFERVLAKYEKLPFLITGCFIKVKFCDFQLSTAQEAMPNEFFESLYQGDIDQKVITLFEKLSKIAYNRGKKPVRLLGIGVNFRPITNEGIQLTLFPQSEWYEQY